MDSMESLRSHLVNLLQMKGAHIDFGSAVSRIPRSAQGRLAPGIPWSAWQLLEHMRIAQWDILEFSRNPDHRSPEWPEGYWPESANPPGSDAWSSSVNRFNEDLQSMVDLVKDPGRDLVEPFAWGNGQTLLREALLVADHNAYHLGEIVALSRVLGVWED